MKKENFLITNPKKAKLLGHPITDFSRTKLLEHIESLFNNYGYETNYLKSLSKNELIELMAKERNKEIKTADETYHSTIKEINELSNMKNNNIIIQKSRNGIRMISQEYDNDDEIIKVSQVYELIDQRNEININSLREFIFDLIEQLDMIPDTNKYDEIRFTISIFSRHGDNYECKKKQCYLCENLELFYQIKDEENN